MVLSKERGSLQFTLLGTLLDSILFCFFWEGAWSLSKTLNPKPQELRLSQGLGSLGSCLEVPGYL